MILAGVLFLFSIGYVKIFVKDMWLVLLIFESYFEYPFHVGL